MRTPAQITGHPIHPMLVTLPIGLWIFSLVCDFVARAAAAPQTWQAAAMYSMVGGILGALAAAVFGLTDLLSLPAGPKSTAVKHMGLNLVIVVLYLVNAWTRRSGAASRMRLLWIPIQLSEDVSAGPAAPSAPPRSPSPAGPEPPSSTRA